MMIIVGVLGRTGVVADVMALNEREAIKGRRLLVSCGVVLVGFIGHAALHIEPPVVALLGAGILGAAVAQSAARLHAQRGMGILLFFAGLFIMVGALVKAGSSAS